MSFGKKLMGLFVEESTEVPEPASTPAPVEASASRPKDQGTPRTPAPAPIAAPPAETRRATTSAEVDAALVEALRKTIADHNLPGFDYYEFVASLKALEAVIPDEAVRFRSAFATASVQGLSLPALLQTSQTYRDLLATERGNFEQELKTRREQDVAKRKQEAEALTGKIAAKAEEIKKLTEEITQLQEKQTKLEAGAEKAQSQLDRALARFLASLTVVDGEIAEHQAKIKTYLGGA